MSILEIIFAFLMIWCISLFIVLPLTRKKGENIHQKPRILRKFIITTITACIGLAIVWYIETFNIIVLLP